MSSAAAKITPAQLGLCAVSGTLVFLAYPNFNHDGLAWFAYVPLLIAVRSSGVKQAFWLGLLAGTITNAGGFHWITQMLQDFGHLPAPVTWLILALQAVTQGLAFAVGAAVWRWLAIRGRPAAVTAMLSMWLGEVITPMVFPWFLGNAISNETLFVQIAELGGVHAVSALLYASNAALFELIAAPLDSRPPSWKMLAGTAAAVALTAGFGAWRVTEIEAREQAAPKLKIGLVEGNIGIWEKQAQHLQGVERVRTLRHNLLVHQFMSAELEKQGAELILWPESAYMPYGPVPVLYADSSFVMVGQGGLAARIKGGAVVPEAGAGGLGQAGEKADFSGLSSPRGDVIRYLAGNRHVVTSAPWHVMVTEAPKGERLVDTVAAPVTMFGEMADGLIASQSGRVWRLGFSPEPLERDGPGTFEAAELLEIPGHDVGSVHIEAIGQSGAGDTWLVGKAGALLRVMGHSVQRVESPTQEDLHDVAGDPLGAELVAVGDNGTILSITGRAVSVHSRGGKHLRAAWFCGDGSAWVAGDDATLLRRRPLGRYKRVPITVTGSTSGPRGVIAGGCDADGNVLLSADGKLWMGDSSGAFSLLPGNGSRAIRSIAGLQAKASYTIPRSARRVLPSSAPLPGPKVSYPANVLLDERMGLGEFDRSSPRRGFSTPLLFGALTYGGVLPRRNNDCRACYNSALLIDGSGRVLETTDKAFLLVFGEYMPFGERFPELYELLPESSRFQPGTRTRPLILGNARIGVVVCYEDLLPRQTMKVAAHDPNVLVNLTNDAWFGQTAEPEHHLQLAQLRTVEYRRWLVRSTNTGISVFIDALGRRRKETALTEAETLMMDVPLLEGRTLYAMLGDWPKVLLVVLMLWLAAGALRGGKTPGQRKKPGKSASKPATRRPRPPAGGNTLKPKKLGGDA